MSEHRMMPKAQHIKGLFRKWRRKEEGEATKADMDPTTIPASQAVQYSSSSMAGEDIPPSAVRQAQAGEGLAACERQAITVGSTARNTSEVNRKGKKRRRSS